MCDDWRFIFFVNFDLNSAGAEGHPLNKFTLFLVVVNYNAIEYFASIFYKLIVFF